jgi:hypothetical protein
MSVKFWSLPLLALALVAFAIPRLARADQQQYVVAYVEFLPASKEVGGKLLEQLASLGRHAKGAISLNVDQEIQRDNFLCPDLGLGDGSRPSSIRRFAPSNAFAGENTTVARSAN